MPAPAGAKKPQDHKKPEPKDGKIVVTVSGHDYTIDADVIDDFELLDDLARLEDGAAQLLPSILRRLVGPEGFKAAMEALRDPDSGRVRIEAGAELVGKIIEAASDPS